MADSDYMEGRIRDLARSAYLNDYITHTDFLSASEQAAFHTALRRLGVPPLVDRVEGAQYLLCGGFDEAERQTVVFLPSWLDAETYKAQEEEEPQVVTCLKISPAGRHMPENFSGCRKIRRCSLTQRLSRCSHASGNHPRTGRRYPD